MKDMILLTKEDCPQCKSLKTMLGNNPKTKDRLDELTMVHETLNPNEYTELVNQYGIQSMPALIFNDTFVPTAQIMPTIMKAIK